MLPKIAVNLRNRVFYWIKPLMPRSAQIGLRRIIAKNIESRSRAIWPVDPKTSKKPQDWPGWPDGKKFGFMLQHDVDTARGRDRCESTAILEQEMGFKSSFFFVPERYGDSSQCRAKLKEMGFEVGVHGLHHDGKLFQSYEIFRERVPKINGYLKEWGAAGFSAPSMHHNFAWMHHLRMKYSIASFDTDPYEPQPDPSGTIFPRTMKNNTGNVFFDFSYSLAQDFTLFIVLQKKNIDIWTEKLDWIADHGGLALIDTHPDYMNFSESELGEEEYPVGYYKSFLKYAKEKYQNNFWHGTPSELADYLESQRSGGF